MASNHTQLERFDPGDIEVVLFDLDGTLRHNRPSSVKVFYDYAVKLGVEDGQGKRLKSARWTHYYWAQSEELLQDVEKYNGDETDFWENYVVRSLLAFDCDPGFAQQFAPQILKYMREEYSPEDHVPSNVPDTLETLLGSGHRLGVLSNRDSPCREYLRELNLDQYFELALVAGEVDAWKPDPRIFEHALQGMSTSADRTVYVGDNYYADIIGARRAGVIPILLDPDNIFPDAECQIIQSFGQLRSILTRT